MKKIKKGLVLILKSFLIFSLVFFSSPLEKTNAEDVYTKKIDLSSTNGSYPYGSLSLADDGTFYGMTYKGGSDDFGVIFHYDPTTNTYTKKIDLSSLDGSNPYGSLSLADDGTFYGMTANGGSNNAGVIFQFILDTTSPIISEVTPVTNPTNDNTPNYTFTTDEAGDITYGGSCSSITTEATVGSNTITFDELADGTYDDCTIIVTDSADNDSNTLTISSFTIDATSPTLSQVTPINNTTDQTPNYTFTTDEAGTITYGGSCSSSTTTAIVGNNTITFNELELGTYSDCTITITDSADNASDPLQITSFEIKRKPSSGSYVGGVRLTTPTVTTSTPTIPSTTLPTTPTNTNNKNTYISPLDNKEYTCKPFTKYLKKGNTNNNKNEVKLWQAFLNKYENEKLRLDGIFGNNTENAVKRFQTKYKEYILSPINLKNATGYIYKSTVSYGNKLLGC